MAIDSVLPAEGLFGGQNAPALTERWAWLADYADLINLISSAAFAFLPVLIGFSAAKRFGGNAYLGAAMGAAMVSSSLTSSYTAIQAQTAGTIGIWRLFGLTIDKIGYQAMVIPVLCVAWVLAAIEKRLHKRLSGTTDFLLTPLITMLATGFLTFVVVGPVTRVLSNGVTNGLAWTYNALGPIGGALFGLAYSPIVVTGLHQSFPAVEIPLIEGIKAGGAGSFIFPIASMANVAQGAAALAVFFKTADARMRGLAGAGGASALFGITEPAIFGVNLRLRWPFFIGMAAAGVGGAGVALLDVRSQALGAAGLVGLVSIVPTSIPRYLALEGLVFILAFVGVFAYATARSRSLTDDVDDAGTAVSKADAQLDSGTTSAVEFPRNAGADLSVTAPIHGIAISLSEVGDRTFASGVLGPGAAIDPVEGPVVSPVDGEVLVAFPTGHAYGLRSASGIELLIHVGMDTVELDGKYFTPRVAAGKRVHRGQVLVEVDWAAVTRAGYRTTTPVVVSNAASFAGIVDEHVGRIVERGDALYTVEAIEPVAARPPASA